jgi:hypothetical protein
MIVGEMNATPQGELQSIEVKINKNGNQHHFCLFLSISNHLQWESIFNSILGRLADCHIIITVNQ